MATIYYSRQYYNQLKRKQCEEYFEKKKGYYLFRKKCYEEYHEEYVKRQNEYYLYEKKYYKEYFKRQSGYYYKKKYYEGYLKRRNKYYLNQKRYYEEYLNRQNGYYVYKKKHNEEHNEMKSDIFANERKYDETDTSQNEFFNSSKTDSVEDSNINDDRIKDKSHGSLEINIEELIGEEDEDKKFIEDYNTHENQVDKRIIEICKTMVHLEPLPICENISDIKVGTAHDKIYDSKSEFFNSFKTGSKEDHNTVAKEELSKETKYKPVMKVSSEILPIYENCTHTSDITAGPVTINIPVVLTECSITINAQSSLKLEDDVLEIKHVRKNVYLNQCKLIPNSENNNPNTGIVFLAGFIRKNIEYSTKNHNDKEVVGGKLKHATVNIPFKCTTRVTFNTPPKFKANTSQGEVGILQTSIEGCNSYKEEMNGRDIREQSFRLMEFFNEKVFCELISAEFVESDILENPTNKECKSPHEQTFHDITEKGVLFLTIKLMQKQNVIISK